MENIGIFCHDAGASEIVSHWANTVKNLYNFDFYLKGPAVSIFERNLNFKHENKSGETIENFIKSNETILCGTSWQSNLEKIAMLKAKELDRKIIVVLDHWVNYKERFILDGNGRWAANKSLPRSIGHKKGAENVEIILKQCGELGLSCVTMYAFSTENWSRPVFEVKALMKLFQYYLKKKLFRIHQTCLTK